MLTSVLLRSLYVQYVQWVSTVYYVHSSGRDRYVTETTPCAVVLALIGSRAPGFEFLGSGVL